MNEKEIIIKILDKKLVNNDKNIINKMLEYVKYKNCEICKKMRQVSHFENVGEICKHCEENEVDFCDVGHYCLLKEMGTIGMCKECVRNMVENYMSNRYMNN